MERLWKFMKNEEGLETVEYAVIASLITLGAIISIGLVGDRVLAAFNGLLSAMGGTPPA